MMSGWLVGWLVGVTTVITLTAVGAEAETETALRLLLLLLLHRRGAVDEHMPRYGVVAGEPRARLPPPYRQIFAPALDQPCPARPDAPCCRLPRAMLRRRRLGCLHCVGECVGECVGDVHDLTRATRVAKPLQQAVSAPPATARADPDRVSSSGRCRSCRSCCRYFWRRS
jgi:hypothetical protein